MKKWITLSTLTAGSLGHVAYVESVNSDGSITISEMNYTSVHTWLIHVQFQQAKYVLIIIFIYHKYLRLI